MSHKYCYQSLPSIGQSGILNVIFLVRKMRLTAEQLVTGVSTRSTGKLRLFALAHSCTASTNSKYLVDAMFTTLHWRGVALNTADRACRAQTRPHDPHRARAERRLTSSARPWRTRRTLHRHLIGCRNKDQIF